MTLRRITYGIRDGRFHPGFLHYWPPVAEGPIIERLDNDHDIPMGDPYNFLKSKRINDMLLQIFLDWEGDDLLILDDDVFLGRPDFPFERLLFPTWIANPIGPENKKTALSTNSTNFYVPHRWQTEFIQTLRMYNEPTINNDVFLFNHLQPYVPKHLLVMDGTFHAQSAGYCPVLRTKNGATFTLDNKDGDLKGRLLTEGWLWFEESIGMVDRLELTKPVSNKDLKEPGKLEPSTRDAIRRQYTIEAGPAPPVEGINTDQEGEKKNEGERGRGAARGARGRRAR